MEPSSMGGEAEVEESMAEDIDVTTQDFVKFWGNFFVFVFLEMFGNLQGFKTF
jgi:hypothetical protein